VDALDHGRGSDGDAVAGVFVVRNVWLAGVIANEACINQMMWVQPQEGWETPKVDEDILRLCYEREKLF
jgi:hypothetical protein